jgi:hypothetical protein
MVKSNTLIFQGIRWSAAQAVPAGTALFEIKTSGHGRKWETNVALAFWRDFYDLSLDDGDAIASFVRRRGDPFGDLDRGEVMHTGHWKNLKAVLGTAAGAWETVGQEGVSQVAADPQRLKLAEYFLRDDPMPVLKDTETVLDPHGPRTVLRAKSLGTFMCLSALSALDRRVPMRRCEHCGSWLELNRKDSRFCSGSCRSFHSQRRET